MPNWPAICSESTRLGRKAHRVRLTDGHRCAWIQGDPHGWALRSVALLALVLASGVVAAAELTLLQTTDIHGFFEHGDHGANRGGWLRVAAAIRQERRTAGKDNTLLIDCGDTVAGTHAAAHSRGWSAVEMLNALEYDAWVLGNHELDYGVSRVGEFCTALPRRVLCGNLTLHPGAPTAYKPPPWRLFERAGGRVVVIGANSAFLDNWLWGRDRGDFSVEPVSDMLRRVLPQIHAQQPDVLVLAVHQGWRRPATGARNSSEVAAIARRFPEIDVILGGHTHREIPGMRLGSTTWYAQAGTHANGYARIRVTVDTEKHRVTDVASQFIPVTEGPADAVCVDTVGPALAEARRAADRTVGIAESAISAYGRAGFGCETAELLCRAIAESADAAVVIHGKLAQHDMDAGPITERDLFALVPYENGIGTAMLTRKQLQILLAEQRRMQSSYVYCGVWGVRARWPEAGGVADLRVNAAGVVGADGERRYRTAFNSYTLASGGGRFPELRRITRSEAAGLEECDVDARQALREYVRRHSPLAIEARQWLRR